MVEAGGGDGHEDLRGAESGWMTADNIRYAHREAKESTAETAAEEAKVESATTPISTDEAVKEMVGNQCCTVQGAVGIL